MFGVVFLLARLFYMRLYMTEPASRIPGAFLTMFSQAGLLVLSIIGVVQAWPSFG